MYINLYGIFSFIFNKAVVHISNVVFRYNRCLYIVVMQPVIRSLFAYIRYGLAFFGSYFVDITAFECSAETYNKIKIYFISYIFYLPRWGYKIVVVCPDSNDIELYSLGEFYTGSIWAEREIGEMFNVGFKCKVDSRRLMLDYVFEGTPLLKKFFFCGYEELEYDNNNNWLIYRKLKLRDNIGIWLN